MSSRNVLITGATRGIGRAIALELAQLGHHVIAAGRDAKALASLKSAPNIQAVAGDVTDEAQVKKLVQAAGERIDVLINNAGAAHAIKNIGELPAAEWRRVIETNLTSMFLVASAAVPRIPKGGIIINVISNAALHPFSGFSGYNASKAGALAFTDTLREELRERGVRVCALVPGATETEIWKQFWPDAPREKMVKPETVAKLVAHICSLPPEAMIDQVNILPTSGKL